MALWVYVFTSLYASTCLSVCMCVTGSKQGNNSAEQDDSLLSRDLIGASIFLYDITRPAGLYSM